MSKETKENVKELAHILMEEVQTALAKGTKHYRKSDNVLLTTVEEIVKAMVDEGEIILEPKIPCYECGDLFPENCPTCSTEKGETL